MITLRDRREAVGRVQKQPHNGTIPLYAYQYSLGKVKGSNRVGFEQGKFALVKLRSSGSGRVGISLFYKSPKTWVLFISQVLPSMVYDGCRRTLPLKYTSPMLLPCLSKDCSRVACTTPCRAVPSPSKWPIKSRQGLLQMLNTN